MLKKMTVLAMAVGLVAALALPSAAMAQWQDKGVNLSEPVQLGLTGKVAFHGDLGGVECQVTSRAKFNPGTTGVAETFDVDPQDETTDCDPTGGLNPCQVHNLTPQQTNNWEFHTAAFQTVLDVDGTQTQLGNQHAEAVVVTAGTLESQLTGGIFCLVKKIVLHPKTVGLVEETAQGGLGDGNAVTNLLVNGTADATIQTNGGSTHTEETLVTGTVTVEGDAAGTYDL